MKIGFTIQEERQEFLAQYCDQVVYIPLEEQTAEKFYCFIKRHLTCDIYIERFTDIGLQMIQLAKTMDLLKSHHQMIHFIDQEWRGGLNARDYFTSLVELIYNERFLTTYRTYRGQEAVEESADCQSHSERLCDEIDYFSETYEKQEKERIFGRREILYGAPLGVIPKYEQRVR